MLKGTKDSQTLVVRLFDVSHLTICIPA